MPPRAAALISSGKVGSGVTERSTRKPAVSSSPVGWLTTWLVSSLPSCALEPDRVTIRAEAMAITKDGIWLVSPSPIVSFVKTDAVWAAGQPRSRTPIAKPPRMLMAVMMSPATASPRTNLLAPSMAPKKSASLLIRSRRRRASCSSMRPALRSASIAICLPGRASRVKRAATSLMRVAPLVMTWNCTITRIRKMMMPTARPPAPAPPPATKPPKALMTWPATLRASSALSASAVRIRRVEAIFRTSRKSVVPSSSEGKTLNSSGSTM
jgi:hypothetical protein